MRNNFLISFCSISIFISLWYFLVKYQVSFPLYFNNLPSPISVIITWFTELTSIDYIINILISTFRVLAGVFYAIVIAFPLGIISGLNKNISSFIFAITEIFRPIPLLAYIPLISVLSSTVEESIIFVTFLGSFFPILINVHDGIMKIPSSYIKYVRTLKISNFLYIKKLVLPFSIQYLYTGILVGLGASWMGVITAETLSGMHGIGYYTWNSYQILEYDKVIVGMFTIGILGATSSFVLKLMQAKFLVKFFLK